MNPTDHTLTTEQRHSLLLRVWEAVNSERDLNGVLRTMAEILQPVVWFRSIAIISTAQEGGALYALHVVGMAQPEGQTAQEFARIASARPFAVTDVREQIPYDQGELTQLKAGQPYLCEDLMAKPYWYAHEFRLAASGIRAYGSFPFTVRGETLGAAVFVRDQAVPFTPEQVSILTDTVRAMGVAVANALANEEINKLRRELEIENVALRTQLGEKPWFNDFVGESAAMNQVLEAIDQVAATDSTVLITGETGTGKELVARALHRCSNRAHGPMIKVNCAAIPPTLLASELFGHERGAFTGATERRKGRFEQADGGTLFLDEIGELPADTQVTLLRVLQERQFERLGGNQTIHVNVRVISATNRDLSEEIRAGRFRSDLFYRLNVFPIRMPALRDHRTDIPVLVAHFTAKHAARLGKAMHRIDRRTMTLLESYSWPGNVRELENVVERGVILAVNGTLRIEKDALGGATEPADIHEHLRTTERETIEAMLRSCKGRVSGENGAARKLGLPASSLEFRIRKLGIDKFRFKAAAGA